ncbi:MAG: hypothetical protein P8K05_01340 [Dehalococcoidia bacterium]|nr:hypothetical protein [Dehalococcoidia bacterium]
MLIKSLKIRIKDHPISSILFVILILIIITLVVPYLISDDKSEANDKLIKNITNPQNIPLSFIELTEEFSSDQLSNFKTLTDNFSIEQIIELEKKLVKDNFEKINLENDNKKSIEESEFVTGSISVKKQYEELNVDYEDLLVRYEELNDERKSTENDNEKNKSKLISLALDNQVIKTKVLDLENEIIEINDKSIENTQDNKREHNIEVAELNSYINSLKDNIDKLSIDVENTRNSYNSGNQNLSSFVRTGQSANYKFNWLELEKKKENESRYLRIDLNNITEIHPYSFKLMNYLPTGSMIPLLNENTMGLVHKTTKDQEFFIGDIVSYIPPGYDSSIGDMDGCDFNLEFVASTNYNHVSHRIIDKVWNEEIEDWKYVPKGDHNNIHDGCYITSEDIKYKLEVIIKIND